MQGRGSSYNFNAKETIEELATRCMKNISVLYVDKIKPQIVRGVKPKYPLKGFTPEEKAVIKLDFNDAKILSIESIREDIRLIIVEAEEEDAVTEFEIVDSITKDFVNNTSKVCTTIITNGTTDNTGEDEITYMIDLLSSHLINLEFFKRGIAAIIGDSTCINGITRLDINRFSCSELYLAGCIVIANMGTVQLCTSDDITYETYIEYIGGDEETENEFPKYLWDAIKEAEYNIMNISDDTIVDYIAHMLEKTRNEHEESGDYAVNPGYVEGEEE